MVVLGAIISLAGVLFLWRARKNHHKREEYWEMERQKGSPLILILLLGLMATAFYGSIMLLEKFSFGFAGLGRASALPDILPYLAAGAIVASSVTAAALFRSLKRVLPPISARPQRAGADEEMISDVLSRTVGALKEGSDYRATVLNCYRAICEILDQGEEAGSSMLTAREFEALVTSRVKIDKGSLHEATLLFERARYSIDPVYDEDAKHAETCLQKLNNDVRISNPRMTLGVH